MHTIEFAPDSKILRFYLWAWETTPEKADFCRMFWGYIFSPIALILKLVGRIFPEREQKPFDMEAWEAEYDEKRAKKLARREKWQSSRAARFLDAAEAFFQRHSGFFVGFFKGLFYLLVAAAVVSFIVAFILDPLAMLAILAVIVGSVALGFVVGGGLAAVCWWAERKHPRVRAAWKGVKGFGRFLADGARHFKARTCPKVVLLDA